jgi:sensor histidine kinase regulating citrate/malate metabolism
MNGKIGALTENSGQASTRSNVKSSNDSLHVVGCVSTYKKKEEVGHLTAYLESQRQYFEEVEEPQDETQYLRAENQKRTEEMLQKAKEELCKR